MKTRTFASLTMLIALSLPAGLAAQAAKPAGKASPAAKAASGQAAKMDPARAAVERQNADRLYDAGKQQEAKTIYARIASFFAEDFAFNKRLATLYLNSPRKEMDRAARHFSIAHKLNPRDADVELNLAKSYSWSGQYAAAIATFRKVLVRDPANGVAHLEIARAQNYSGQYAAARQTYEDYLKRRPSDREVRLEYAALLSLNKDYEGALAQYRQVLKAQPSNVNAKLGEAGVLSWQGKLNESLKVYDEVLRGAQNRYEALRGKAFALLWLQRYEDADELFAQANRLRPPDKETQEAVRQIARWKAEEPDRRRQMEMDQLRQQINSAMAQNNLPRAAELIRQAMDRTTGQDRANLEFRLGQVYRYNRQFKEAIEILSKQVAANPQNVDALRELGEAQAGANRLPEAVNTFRALLEKMPQDVGARLTLAQLQSWAGRFVESIANYQQVLDAQPDNSEAALGLAQATAWNGEVEKAISLFDNVLRRRPGNREALMGKGMALHWSGASDKALALLETMRETWPQDREIAQNIQVIKDAEQQRILVASGRAPVDVDDRIRNYEQTLARSPNSLTTLQRLGDLHAQKKDYTTAVSYYEKALALQPEDNNLKLLVARVSSWNRDFAKTVTVLQGLVAQNPQNMEYRAELARNLGWAGRNKEAIEQYREILKSNPQDADTRLQLARILSWNKQFDESLAEYSELLKSDPGNPNALIERARVYSWKGDLQAAINLYDEVLIRAPEDRDARFGKAQTLYWGGRAREAKDILEELQVKNPKDRDVGLTVAGVHAALGRRDLALRQLDALDQLQPGNSEVDAMRRSICQDLRPVLTVAYTPSVDSGDLQIHHITGQISFNLAPQVRSYVFAGVIPTRDIPFGNEMGRELLFGSSGRVNEWMLLRGEVGVNSNSSGTEGAIGGGGATFFINDRMQLDVDASRRYINFIPQPILLDISRVQIRTAWDWRPDPKTSFHIDYFHQRYSDTNRNNGGNVYFLRNLVKKERLDVDSGYLYAVSGFTKQISSGFFAPSQFQRHAWLGNVRSKMSPWAALSFYGSLGREQTFRNPFQWDGTARVQWDFIVTPNVRFAFGYGYFAISSVGRVGIYRTHSVYIQMESRF